VLLRGKNGKLFLKLIGGRRRGAVKVIIASGIKPLSMTELAGD
jgi:hypothetical protein